MNQNHSLPEGSEMPESGPFAGVNPIMAVGSAVLVIAFVLFTVIDPEYAGSIYSAAKGFIATDLAWYYVGVISFFLFFCHLVSL